MAEQATGSRIGRAGWVGALIVVPLALAVLSLVWPGPQFTDGLRQRSAQALAAAGLTDVAVTVDGRDVALARVPAGAERSAADAVRAVPGIRAVTVAEPSPAAAPPVAPATGPTPSGGTGTAVGPTTPAGPTPAPEPLADRLGRLLADAPVTFAPDRAELTGTTARTVQEVADLLVPEPDVPIAVEGHAADTPGPVEFARRLADRRAEVVTEALVAAGVDRARITTRGLGATQPLATPAASRRVEIRIR